MLLIDLFETKIQRTQLMYHGTASSLVPSILKFGLVAEPPKRTYSRDTDVEQQGYDSYSGVYLTTNFNIARNAAYTAVKAHGGDPVLITLQYVITSGSIDEDEITALLLAALTHVFGTYAMETIGGLIARTRPALESELIDLIINYKTLDVGDYHPPSELKFTADSIAQFKTVIARALDVLAASSAKTPGVEGEYYIAYYLLPELRYDAVYDNAITRLLKTLKSKNPITVRIERNIGFRGKTRILSIVNLNTKELLYGVNLNKKTVDTKVPSKLVDRTKLRKDADYYFFGNFAKRYAWGIGQTPESAMDDAEEQFEIYAEDFDDVEWEDELRVCRIYPTDKYTYNAIERKGSDLDFVVKDGLVVVEAKNKK